MLSESLIQLFSILFSPLFTYIFEPISLYFENTVKLICTLQSGSYPVAILIRVLGGERIEVRVELGRDHSALQVMFCTLPVRSKAGEIFLLLTGNPIFSLSFQPTVLNG